MRWLPFALAVVGLACPAPATVAPPQVPVAPTPPPPPPPDVAPPRAAALEPPQPTLRLPHNFTPASYRARLAIDPKRPTFDGSLEITGDVSERSAVIWLHGRHLDIKHASASRDSGAPVALAVTPRGDDLLEVRADPPLDPGAWRLAFDYTGQFDQVNTTGAFVETAGGAPYVYSQFEAIYARRVFPCFDEPSSKVPWQLTLDVPKDLVAVSNTPEVQTTPLGTTSKRVEFARTKPLPSYLVAFGVGPFDIVDAGTTKAGTPVRIITLKGRKAEAAWAAKTTPRIVDLLEEWFGMPYPYEKLDMLTIPTTVGFGAMENAGLVTATERVMLIDPVHLSLQREHHWVSTASHELAHQWFGDYVTTAWWDDIWLNEGFANWLQTKILAKFDPTWRDELGELQMRDSALEADSIVSARQIRQPIEQPGDILNVFDSITYDKGASVLNMFEHYVGPDVFRRGVQAYLRSRAYGSATSADFIAAISEVAGKDLAPAFSTLLDQPGEPEIEPTLACDGAPRVELAQRRYLPPGSGTAPPTRPWILPVCVAYERAGKRAEACTLLDQPKATLALETKTCPRWIMANVGGRGYYRIKATAKQVIALRDEAWPQLAWTERRALLYDVAEAQRIRERGSRELRTTPPRMRLPLQLALSLVPKMLTAGDRFTTSDALALPLALDRFVADDQRAKYEAWIRAAFGPGAVQLGLSPRPADDLDAETMRADLFDAAAWLGRDPELVKQAVAAADHWRDLRVPMRGTILAVAVDASPELFERVLRETKTEPDRSRRDDMVRALATVRDPKRAEAALQLLLDPALDIRDTMWMLYATTTPATRQVAEAFYRAHEAELLQRLPQDEVSGGLGQTTELFTSACDPRRRDEVREFATKHFGSAPGGARVVDQALETMEQCLASRTMLEPQVRAWLGGYRLPRPDPKKTKPGTKK